MKLTGNLRQIATLKGYDKVVGILDAVLGDYPELDVIPGRTIKGTEYKIVTRKANPQGGFRRANQGVDGGEPFFGERRVQTFIYDNPIVVDKKVAQAHEDGEDNYLAIMSEANVSGAMQRLGSQFYYGKSDEDELGFPGLAAYIALFGSEFPNAVNAGGTTANAATTAYLVRMGDDGVEYIFGQGTGLEVSPFVEQFVPDNQGKLFRADIADLAIWIGLAVNHPRSVVAVQNLTSQPGKGMTDALAQAAFGLLPVSFKQDKSKLRWLMNSTQVGLLQTSRTAINQQAYKLGAVADYPTDLNGIAIVETNSIVSTEPLVVFPANP